MKGDGRAVRFVDRHGSEAHITDGNGLSVCPSSPCAATHSKVTAAGAGAGEAPAGSYSIWCPPAGAGHHSEI